MATDWDSIESYDEVYAKARDYRPPQADDFLAGPIARLCAIAVSPTHGGRAGARVMECCAQAWGDYRRDAVSGGASEAELQRAADAFVADHLGEDGGNRDYLLDVWDGVATHNYTADVPRAERLAKNPAEAPLPEMGITARLPAEWRDYFALTKPRVMSLVVFTGLCGLLAAPGSIHPVIGFTAVLCIALGAGGAGALNQWWEADIDAGMKRTSRRPLPSGRMQRTNARDFGIALSVSSVLLMGLAVNWLAAAFLALSIVYYAVVYTIWLKPRTPQNIVIGGGAGAFPPFIGWIAVTNEITLMPVLLFAIIFMWTPPHFWALALFVKTDYAKVGIPMLPVVAGEAETRRQILIYSVILLVVSLVPWWIGGTGWLYGGAALLLSGAFLVLSLPVAARRAVPVEAGGDRMKPEKRLFGFSVLYLFALFAALVADRVLLGVGGVA